MIGVASGVSVVGAVTVSVVSVAAGVSVVAGGAVSDAGVLYKINSRSRTIIYLTGAVVSTFGSGFGFGFTSMRTMNPFSFKLYSLNFFPSSSIFPWT